MTTWTPADRAALTAARSLTLRAGDGTKRHETTVTGGSAWETALSTYSFTDTTRPGRLTRSTPPTK